MDVEHQVLKIGVDTGLCIDGSLLVRQKMVELHNTNCNCFKLLCFEHDLLQNWVFDYLISYYCRKVSSFSHVPPVVTIKRSVAVVAETLSIYVQSKSTLNYLPQGFSIAFALRVQHLPS